MRINILDSKRQTTNPDRELSVQRHGRVVLGVTLLNRLGLNKGDYVLFGEVAGNSYICKKPEGYFGYQIKGEKSGRALRVQSKVLAGMDLGEYRLGTAFIQDEITWFPLLKI